MKTSFSSRFLERFLITMTVLFAAFTVLSVIIGFSNKFEFLNEGYFNHAITFLIHIVAITLIELFYVLVLQIFLHPHTGFGFHFRLIFFFLAALFGICFLLQKLLIPQIILPFAFVQYLLTSSLFEAFLKHDDFEKVCENKKGLELKSDLAKDKYVAQDFVQNISTVQLVLFIMALFFIVFILSCQIITHQVPVLSYIFAIFFIISGFSILQLLSIYEKEIFYAFLGFEEVFNYRMRIFFFSLIFLIVCLAAGLLLSSNYAVLKKEYLLWFFSLFHKEKAPVEIKNPEVFFGGNMPAPEQDIGIGKIDGNIKGPNHLAELLIRIIQFSLIGGLIVGFFIYVFKPIVNKDVSRGIKEKKILKILKNFFNELKEMISKLFGFKIDFEPYASVSSREFKLQMTDLIGKSKKTKEKKIELDRLTRQFVLIINWGESKEVKYRKSQAPAEYTTLLYKKTQYEELNEIGSLFEKALYSKDLLSKEEEQKYKQNIEKVLHYQQTSPSEAE